jgi:hypothetical protein
MVEQKIARGVAHYLVQCRPRRLRIERIVEQLLDQAENRFSLARFQTLRKGQVLPAAEPGAPGLSGRTLISCVIGPHVAPASWGVSVACQEPAAGALISVNQKYGGLPCRSREVAATLPSGPVRESSP